MFILNGVSYVSEAALSVAMARDWLADAGTDVFDHATDAELALAVALDWYMDEATSSLIAAFVVLRSEHSSYAT